MSKSLKDFASEAREASDADVVEEYVTLSKIFPIKRGVHEGKEWIKVGVKTDKGVYFGFKDAIKGIDETTFIPKNGVDAIVTIKPESYENDKGEKVDGYKIISLIVNNIGLKAQLASEGLLKSGWSGGLSI